MIRNFSLLLILLGLFQLSSQQRFLEGQFVFCDEYTPSDDNQTNAVVIISLTIPTLNVTDSAGRIIINGGSTDALEAFVTKLYY